MTCLIHTSFPRLFPIICKEKKRISLNMSYNEDVPCIQYSLVVNERFDVTVCISGIRVESNDLAGVPFLAHTKLVTCEQLYEMLNYLDQNPLIKLESSIVDHVLHSLQLLSSSEKLEFIKEQLSLMYSKRNGGRYSHSLLCMATMWHDISPATYNQMLADNVLTLPSPRHLRRLTSALKADLDLADSSIKYLTVRKEKLAEKDLKVAVLLDEVHCRMKVQYSNGKFYGLENGEATKTLLCTMVKSVAGKYRDVVSMTPITNINAEKVYIVWMNIIKVLKNIGFDVVPR